MITNSWLLFFAVFIPLVSAPLSLIFSDKVSNRFTALSNVVNFLVIAGMYSAVSHGKLLVLELNTGFNFKLSFMADSLSLLCGLIFIAVWTLTSFYSIGYMSHEHAQRRYNLFSLLSLAGTLGVVFTRNLFSLYIFFEILSVASYVMVVHEESFEARKAGLKYILMGIIGGLTLLLAMVCTYHITGTVDLL